MDVVFLYIFREDIPSKELKMHNSPEDIESIFIETNLIKTKWLCKFFYECNAKNVVKEKICFKNALNLSCIDLFITNSLLSFQNTIAVSIGLSDFHKMVIIAIKMSFKKHSPTERDYRDYKYFDQTKFENNRNEKLNAAISNCKSLETFFIELLNKYALLRKKFLSANCVPYITKTLRKAIMRRS